MNTYIRLLRQRPEFRYLWFAQVVSLLGDWFNLIATIILVNRYTDSGLAFSLLFIARGVPPFLLGPVAGVVADRFNRKTVLITSDLLRMVIVLGFLLVNSADRVWLVYVLTTLQFCVSAFFEPARSALLPSLIRQDELMVGNTLASATWSVVLALGGAIGAFTANAFGVETAIIIDALTFLLSALFLLQVVPVFSPPKDDEGGTSASGWVDMVDGFKYVAQRPRIGIFTLVKGLAQVGSVDIMFALYAEEIFVLGEDGALSIGILYSFFGIGAVLGPLIGNRFGNENERILIRLIWVGFVLLPLSWFGYSLAPYLLVAAIAILIRGAGGSIGWTYSNVMLQLKVPDRFLGRVFALDFSIFTLSYVISVLLTGYLADTLEIAPRTLALWMGIGSILPFVFWTLIWRNKNIEEMEFTKPTSRGDE